MKEDKLMKLLLGALVLLVVTGCMALPSGPGAVVGDFMLTLSVNGHAYTARVTQGEAIYLGLDLINRGRSRKTITLTQRPAYDFVITTEGGMEVWRWTYGKTIEDISREIEASLGLAFGAHVTWGQRDLDGHPVPRGTYWVQGTLHTHLGTLKSQKVKLSIGRGPALVLEIAVPSQAPSYWRQPYWQLGQPLVFSLKLRNVTDRPVELTLLGRPAYDIAVSVDYDRKEIWRFSRGQPIHEIAELRRLAPLEELHFSVEWNQRDNEGNPIEPGEYCVKGFLNVTPEVEPTPTRCMYIGQGLPVRLSLDVPSRVRIGESVPIVLKIENITNCPVTLVGTRWNFAVTTLDGTLVLWSGALPWWRLPFPVPLHPPEYIMTLQPGETKAVEMTWDQFDNEGYPVKPGVYRIQGLLSTVQDVTQSAVKELLIEP